MSDPQFPLSPAGRTRREQILALALETSRRKRRSRTVVRGAMACVGVAIAVSAAFRMERGTSVPSVVMRTSPPVPPAPFVVAQPDFIKLRRSHPIVIARIETDPHISSRLEARSNGISIDRISDDQLLNELASADQPAGLARVGGKLMLLMRR